MRIRMAMALSATICADTLAGCVEMPQDALYYETYEVKNLTVILLDDKAVQRRWQAVSGSRRARRSSLRSQAVR